MEKDLIIFTDGGARGNPGPAAVGVVIKSKIDEEKEIARFGKTIGETTNNVAEYTAVIEAFSWIKNNLTMEPFDHISVTFYLDSKLVVNQLSGLFKIKEARLRELLFTVRQLESELKINAIYRLVPREENYLADFEVNKALDGQ